MTHKVQPMSAHCPESDHPGRLVKTATVEHLTHPGTVTGAPDHDWFLCEAAGCNVVYFSPGRAVLLREDVTVRVGTKEEAPPHLVCYCFDHSLESIREELRRTGESTVVASVTERIQAGLCSCERLNPKGVCCLGDLNAALNNVFGTKSQDEDESSSTGCCEE